MWFGSRNKGLFRWKQESLQQFTIRDGLADDFVIALHEDSDGVLWIATANGLNRFVPPGVGLGVPAAADGSHDTAEAARKPEPAKAGTPSENADRFFTFTTAHGLLDDLINHILEDDDGFLWFSCNRGIFRIARSELNAVADGRKTQVVCAVFGTADGMPSSETNGEHQPAGCKARDGKLWFPTTKGIVVIDPRNVHDNGVVPPVVIEQVKADNVVVFGDEAALGVRRLDGALDFDGAKRGTNPSAFENESGVEPPHSIRLGPGRARVLEIRYTANSFVAPEKIRFKFKLEGSDKDWRSADSSERRATYADLRPGHYTFRVKACNNHGVWNEAGASFAFSLAPKFTQTSWFPLSCAAGLLAVSGTFTGWRLRWQRRTFQAERASAVEQERARIARDLHDDLGTDLTGVALRVDVARRHLHEPEVLDRDLQKIAQRTRELVDQMRELIWAINPQCDTLESFASYLGEFAEGILAASSLRCRLDFPESFPPLPLRAEVRHDLWLVMKEALNNVVKHAAASEVRIHLAVDGHRLTLLVEDNGRGLNPAGMSNNGHGVANMRQRVEARGGELMLDGTIGRGTTVTIRLQLEAAPCDLP